ncbi:MAG: MoaD/ThiS family protein [Desulfobacterales bacterium]|nr:MoaD/ThiS family protein [Desulfobacterales bacterium]
MKIYLKCFASLTNEEHCDHRNATPFDVPAGQTVNNLLTRVGVAREAVKIAFVNNRIAGMDTVLADGDRVALAPAVGGM